MTSNTENTETKLTASALHALVDVGETRVGVGVLVRTVAVGVGSVAVDEADVNRCCSVFSRMN